MDYADENEPLIVERRRGSSTYGSDSRIRTSEDTIINEISDQNGSGFANQTNGGAKTFVTGSRDVLSAKYESLDYDVCENKILLDEVRSSSNNFLVRKMLARWLIFFLIGVFTALVGVAIDIAIDKIATVKYGLIKQAIDECIEEDCLYKPYLIWAGMNAGFVLVGAFLVAYIEPVAGGSGIPQVKCYLNGVKIPRLVRLKTLFVKAIGVVSSVVGGLAGGKEGPMIHTGAVIAAGISQGKSTSMRSDFRVFRYFREDHEKRDFVSGGAAAGVAAAFGAPVGGVLFSLEEGSSFWNQSLTWRIFFASSVSVFTLNIILSAYHGHPGELTYYGLLNFGHFESLNYDLFELILYAWMGAVGGLLGSLYIHVNYKLTVFRMRYIRGRWLKVIEACLVAAITATVAMLMMFCISDCRSLGQDPTENPIQMYCGDGEYSSVAALWLQNPEASVRSLFHDPPGSQNYLTLFVFTAMYLGLSIWTYGLSVSAGIFIPCLLTGAGWGRLTGMCLGAIFPNADWVDPGKYALVGAAAQLGGVVRMTISLTIILIEATGNINFGLPLMITLMTAKWVGDYFTEGFYDLHIQLSGVPLLPWEPPAMSFELSARGVMSYPVLAFSPVEKVRTIVEALTSQTYNGFPIVERVQPTKSGNGDIAAIGKLRGLILQSQLIVILQRRTYVYLETKPDNEPPIPLAEFRNNYPRYKNIKDIYIPEEEMDYTIDLRPYMNPSPYTVQDTASFPRVFRLFRALGLRHLIVVNESNEVVGMVTRKDIARYRAKSNGALGVEELNISDKL
ncbi:Chloride channel [Nesidiocoris tenuis]|uniref:Chloride channel protein n=1 Tax=Nesidiocoris tenuis TaxID=355587 RepID=A0ABN7BAL4_9HEMI|nr:Chloride channel [Nesidiocoris tenuis]